MCEAVRETLRLFLITNVRRLPNSRTFFNIQWALVYKLQGTTPFHRA
nr:MAG TPA: hypothetical protein [Caudoviricetes sp.]